MRSLRGYILSIFLVMFRNLLNPIFVLRRKRLANKPVVFVRPDKDRYRKLVKEVLQQHQEALHELRDR